MRTYNSDKITLIASEYNGWAFILMRKQLLIGTYFSTTLIMMTTFKHYFAQKISSHAVYPIKLTFVPTKWTGIRILLKPMKFTIATKWFFACFAFNWVFKYVITDSTN